MKSVFSEMSFLFDDHFVMQFSTHTPIMHCYQHISKYDSEYDYFDYAKYKFIGGSNIFKRSVRVIRSDWNINAFDYRFYKDVITIGCGSSLKDSFSTDYYTKNLYGKILNKKYFHSVRDEKSKKLIENLGGRAINTGCVTLWSLTREHCERIPVEKNDCVVFTLTGYKRDVENDQYLVNTLNRLYDEVYFWPQSIGDYPYLCSLSGIKDIKIIPANLDAYEKILKQGNIDYCGTRLHGGVFAIKNGNRSIIISIDNRAEDMDLSNNLNCINRKELQTHLERRIMGKFETNIIVDRSRIEDFKAQFR